MHSLIQDYCNWYATFSKTLPLHISTLDVDSSSAPHPQVSLGHRVKPR